MAHRGFSLIELTIVLAIIVIVAAIAVPRFSRGVDGASRNALGADLALLHRAVDLYAADHDGRLPDSARVVEQLTRFTCPFGNISDERTEVYIFGPYLRCIPPLPVGPRRGQNGVAHEPGEAVGWIYDAAAGTFAPNMDP